MKLVPTYRLLCWVGIIFLPATLLMVAVTSTIVPTLVLAMVVTIAAGTDAYRSRERLKEVRVRMPEIVRISEGRQAHFDLLIENPKMI